LRIRTEILDFSKAFQINIDSKIAIEMTAVLTEEYGYTIQEIISEQEELGVAVYICSKSKTLYFWISMNNKGVF
jgi:hypothetical protein